MHRFNPCIHCEYNYSPGDSRRLLNPTQDIWMVSRVSGIKHPQRVYNPLPIPCSFITILANYRHNILFKEYHLYTPDSQSPINRTPRVPPSPVTSTQLHPSWRRRHPMFPGRTNLLSWSAYQPTGAAYRNTPAFNSLVFVLSTSIRGCACRPELELPATQGYITATITHRILTSASQVSGRDGGREGILSNTMDLRVSRHGN